MLRPPALMSDSLEPIVQASIDLSNVCLTALPISFLSCILPSFLLVLIALHVLPAFSNDANLFSCTHV